MTISALLGKFIEIKAKVKPKKAAEGPADASNAAADFVAIYRQAGIAPAAYSGEQALAFLSTLAGEKDETKRHTLAAITSSLGTSPEAVAEDARRKAAALGTAIDRERKKLADLVTAKDAEIKALERQRAEKAEAVQAARARERQLTDRYLAEAKKFEELQEFLRPNAG